MASKKKTFTTTEEIEDFLNQTGFVFEMRMNEVFSKNGYVCAMNEMFSDLEGGIDREIDLIASKNIGHITLHFVVECKQSFIQKWIFICSNAKDKRYYSSVKHLPHVDVDSMKETGLFSELHIFDRRIPLSHNYLCFSKANNKKGDQTSIEDCIYKLPKALIDFASRVRGGRNLFFPVALFSGQLFAARYEGSLIVEERDALQYYVEFGCKAYEERSHLVGFGDLAGVREHLPPGLIRDEWRLAHDRRIKSTARKLSPHFPIDFVTEAGFQDYLGDVEKRVAEVRVDAWPIRKEGAAEVS